MTKTLYLCYFGLREPLVQTQVLPYLRQLADAGMRVYLLTFEPNRRRAWSPEETEFWRGKLEADGIRWVSLPYHKRLSLLATSYDIAAGAWLATRLLRRHNIDVLHARGHVPAAIGALTKQLSGGRLIFDIRGFMPEEYVDAGLWLEGSYLYRLTKAAERRLLNAADGFVVLTEKARNVLFPGCAKTDRRGRPIEVIPCCVDLGRFRAADHLSREVVRKELGISDRRVLVYVGAFGTWYLADELAEFIAVAHRQNEATFSMILTQSAPEVIAEPLRRQGVKEQDYLIRQIPPKEIPEYLKAADIALSFIKPCYSKLASSPTKIAEYLASGLPVICNTGIGDVDEIIEGNKVGVVIRDFSREAYQRAMQQAEELLQDTRLAERCYLTARRQFDLQEIGGRRYRRLYQRLVGGEERVTTRHEEEKTGDCPICERSRSQTWGYKNNFELRFCLDCRSVFTRLRPGDDEIRKIYDHCYERASFETPPVVVASYERLVCSFAGFRSMGRLLDIGYGEGGLLKVAQAQGWDCYGTEIAPNSLAHGERSGWVVTNQAITDTRFPPGGFDVVTMIELLEHVPEPLEILRAAARWLRPGGLLYATTPNASSLNSWFLGLKWSIVTPPEHLAIWTARGINQALAKAGFTVQSIRAEGFNPAEILGRIQSRSQALSAADRNQAAFALNGALSGSPSGRVMKAAINNCLSVFRIGDSLKVWAIRE